MPKEQKINVKGTDIVIFSIGEDEYISITDIARYKNPDEPKDVVKNWMRSRSTIEFMGLWEKIHNPEFKGVEFDPFLYQAGSNSFVLSPSKWIEATNAKGIISRAGTGGGTFAHRDIAFEFASWISAEFKLYLLVEFQRLKQDENERFKLEWNLQRTLAKINYKIHTDAIKEKLIPPTLSKDQINAKYANEADLLNVALFGFTAKSWRDANPNLEGNVRDNATIEQLVVLSNMESINATLIHQGLNQSERLIQLNSIAITQMRSLLGSKETKKLKS
ncbi:MAG: KilA-N domain-containing protein [Patescibacteria group bacterium]|nr:KilA-N domain-containing protein [Patescibacteria group bacterium]